jgi:two-component system, cell cycle sensor histidine kinase and response regulator CckA
MSHRVSRASGISESGNLVPAIHLVKPIDEVNERGEERALLQTILLVEDETFVREVTREVLRAAGYSVVAVRTAAEAACVYEEVDGAVDLLLTDVILPGETGPELVAKLRQQSPALRALYVTGYAEQMKSCGVRGERFLAKPYSSGKLLSAVRQALFAKEPDAEQRSGVPSVETRVHHLGGNV